MNLRLLLLFLLLFGALAFVVSLGGALLLDWPQLQKSDAAFRAAAQTASMREVFVLEARQNIHRINLFADGVWCLLGALLCAVCAGALKK